MTSSPTRERLGEASRIVVKLGTAVVTHAGGELALGRVHGLVEDIAGLHRAGRQVIVVSSGSVAMGAQSLGLDERPRSLGLRQACAAVGQGQLIALYGQAFAQLGLVVAQVLLTQDDLGDRDRALCLRTTLMRLLELGTVPILNENDSVSVRELVDRRPAPASAREVAFGDNDGLSARVAIASDAEALVLLTDVDGVFSADPTDDPTARKLDDSVGLPELVPRVGRASSSGTGGMASKLEAVKLVSEAGIVAVIADGSRPRVLGRLLEAEPIGTVVWPATLRPARRVKIAVGGDARGALVANDGAIAALTERKASLLPIGVVNVDGQFERGEVVEIRDESGRIHARGLANYDSCACRSLLGHHSDDIESVLGYRGYDALVTRDNLVLGEV